MKIRKVSAELLNPGRDKGGRPPSARELRRRALEKELDRAIRAAEADPQMALQVTLDEGEKAATVRAAFGRVREQAGSTGVNLFARDGTLYIAKRPQTRGRRRRI